MGFCMHKDSQPELDKKLEEIIMDYGQVVSDEIWYQEGYGDRTEPPEASELKTVEQIKQAFIDDGWSKVDKRQYRDDKGRQYEQFTFDGGYVRIPKFEMMTGQEWYDRFEKEMIGLVLPYCVKHDGDKYVKNAAEEALKAAKRASGISEETK